jgi:hypothetical protein
MSALPHGRSAAPCRRRGPTAHSWFQSRGQGRRHAPWVPNKGSLSKGLGWSSYLRVPSAEPRRGPTSAGFCFCPCGDPAPFKRISAMVSSAYLRQQVEILIAMSRATLDLGMAGRLGKWRQNCRPERPSKRTPGQPSKMPNADNEMANFKRPVRIWS